jgi:hypothetical protein
VGFEAEEEVGVETGGAVLWINGQFLGGEWRDAGAWGRETPSVQLGVQFDLAGFKSYMIYDKRIFLHSCR